MPPRGLNNTFVPHPNEAVDILLALLYQTPRIPVAATNEPKSERNLTIRKLYGEGLSIPKLARQFGLSNARVHQILHGRNR